MMAYLTRRRFSNGGEVLPKPKPKLPQIKLYVDKLKTYLEAGAIEPEYAIQLLQERMKKIGFSNEELAEEYSGGGNEEASLSEEYYGKDKLDWMNNHSDQMTFEEYLQWKRAQAANGGSVKQQPRRKYWAGALGMAPTVAYPAMVGVAKLLGITTAGLGAKELSNVVTQKIKENPEILETPQAKAIMLTFGLTPTNLFKKPEEADDQTFKTVTDTPAGAWIGPDAGQIEKEKEKMKERLKPPVTHKPDPFPIHTGHPRPEIKKEEPPVSPPVDIPQLGGSEIPETKLEDLIFYTKKVEDIKEPKAKQIVTEVLEKQKKEIPKLKTKEDYEKFIRGIEDVKVNTKYKPVILNKEYLGVLKEYAKKFHDSNIKNASTDLSIEGTTLSERLRAIGFKGKGNIQTLSVEQGTLSLTDALNDLQDNNEESVMEINERLENSGVSKNGYAHLADIGNLIGMDGSNADQRNALGKIIRTLGVKKEGDSKRSRIDVGDFLEKINLYATQTRKNVSGEGEEGYKKYKSQLDIINPGLRTVHSNVRNHIRRKLDDAGLKLKDEKGNTIALGEDTGHAESLKLISNYPDEFKGSNAKSLQTNVDQDPVVNQDILVNRGYHSTNGGILKDFKDKKITITEVNERLKANHDRIVEIIQETAKELPHFKNQEKRIALLQMNKNGVINADMSTVDKNYISGNINKINPKATKVSDLSKEEKAQYISNIVDQYVDNAYNFLIQMKDDAGNPTYSREEINDFLDMFYTPIGLGKKQYRIQRNKGGSIYGKYAKQVAGIS